MFKTRIDLGKTYLLQVWRGGVTIGIAFLLFPLPLEAQVALQAPSNESGSVLPFPRVPSASRAGRTLQESTYKTAPPVRHLPADAPNIVIIMLDDAGPGLPSTYGGDIQTPTLSRVAKSGISFNRFHTTAMCSPTRAALLTGRNHHRLGQGQIASLANNWDGYNGVMPESAASLAKVLGYYGYSTSAFGKWHNTPHTETTSAGPFERWPTGRIIGFDHFFGFLSGESSQWEPLLVENTTFVAPETKAQKHLTEQLSDRAIKWLRDQQAIAPDKPFLMYWAPGAVHAPHHIHQEWADKYKGHFDAGWDAMRARVLDRQKAMGWVPPNTTLTPRPTTLPAWSDIPERERAFQLRLMEVFAGYAEHADAQAGRVLDELDRLGIRENTLVFYLWGDNGSSAEGMNGTVSEFLAQSGTKTSIEAQLRVVEEIGGVQELGGPKTDNHYHAAWAWAGSTPFQGTKLLASHLGGTRTPLAVSWPKSIRADAVPRPQFHHVNDIVPTIYELLKIQAPKSVDGVEQIAMDGTSMVYAFDSPMAPGRKRTQYFEIMGSRALYQDGWMASAFGPRVPWQQGVDPSIYQWTPDSDKWELYDLSQDFSQAVELSAKYPEKLAAMKAAFETEAKNNDVYPIGGGLWIGLHPEFTVQNPMTEFHYTQDIVALPEGNAPKLGFRSNSVTVETQLTPESQGVLYAIGAYSGGVASWIDAGKLNFEYNLYMVERTRVTSTRPLPQGKAVIEVQCRVDPKIRNGPMRVVLKVNGEEVGQGTVPRTTGFSLSGNGSFDVGTDVFSPVSAAYYDRAPFSFNSPIDRFVVKYLFPDAATR